MTILFPTPNRVREGVFKFMEQEYEMILPDGQRRILHGLAWDDCSGWTFEDPSVSSTGAMLKCIYTLTEKNPRFCAFSFPCELIVKFLLQKDALKVEYEVKNLDDVQFLGFGFGLHPFWRILGNREDTFLRVSSKYHMKSINLLPTGSVDEDIDLSQWTPISELSLDDVFLWGDASLRQTQVIHKIQNLMIDQVSTDDFTHVVVYTPQDANFFCVENQTCSTDAHNLYSKGYEDVSHLQILKPNSRASGHVVYKLIDVPVVK